MRIFLHKSIVSAVIIMAIIAETIAELPTNFLSAFSSFAPKRCAIGREKPAHTMIIVIRNRSDAQRKNPLSF